MPFLKNDTQNGQLLNPEFLCQYESKCMQKEMYSKLSNMTFLLHLNVLKLTNYIFHFEVVYPVYKSGINLLEERYIFSFSESRLTFFCCYFLS